MALIEVDPQDLRRLSGHFAATAGELGRVAVELHLAAAAGQSAVGAGLDPVGAARAMAALLAALDGPHGVAALAARVELDVIGLVAATVLYEVVDGAPWAEVAGLAEAIAGCATPGGLVRRGPDAVRAAGAALEATATWVTPATEQLLPLLALAGATQAPLLLQLAVTPPALRPGVIEDATGRMRFLYESIGWRQSSVDPVTGRPLAEWALRWPQGPGGATPVDLRSGEPTGYWADRAGRPIGTIDAAMDRVAQLSGGTGRIAVEEVRAPGGGSCWVVELPGIQSFGDGPTPRDLPGAIAGAAFGASSYTRAVRVAVDRAGVPPGARVMLVGHSHGGLTAMHLAADAGFNGRRVQVTHVVATGAPVTHVEVPTATRVLTVENTHDLVTHLDNEDSRNRPGGTLSRVDVAFSEDLGSVAANHSAALYAQELRRLADSPDAGVRDFLHTAEQYLVGPAEATGWALTDAASPAPRLAQTTFGHPAGSP